MCRTKMHSGPLWTSCAGSFFVCFSERVVELLECSWLAPPGFPLHNCPLPNHSMNHYHLSRKKLYPLLQKVMAQQGVLMFPKFRGSSSQQVIQGSTHLPGLAAGCPSPGLGRPADLPYAHPCGTCLTEIGLAESGLSECRLPPIP